MVLRVPAYSFHVFAYIYHFFSWPSSSALSSSPDIPSCIWFILLVWFSTVLPLGYYIFSFHFHFCLHFLQYYFLLSLYWTLQALNCHHYFIQLFVFSWTSIRDLFLGTRVLLGSWWWYMWLPGWGLTRRPCGVKTSKDVRPSAQTRFSDWWKESGRMPRGDYQKTILLDAGSWSQQKQLSVEGWKGSFRKPASTAPCWPWAG